MTAFPKAGTFESRVLLEMARRMECQFCTTEDTDVHYLDDCPWPVQAHHYPPKGRGVTRDDCVIPLCGNCHRRAHGNVIVINGVTYQPISSSWQETAVKIFKAEVWDTATAAEWARIADDRDRWIASRGGGVR